MNMIKRLTALLLMMALLLTGLAFAEDGEAVTEKRRYYALLFCLFPAACFPFLLSPTLT